MTGTSAETLRKLELALDRIRPGLLRDGGNVELLAMAADGTVQLEFQGACVHCPAQSATVRFALEPALREAVPEVSCVVPVPGDPTPLGD